MSIKLIGLLLLPIYTDKLTTEQYGMWSILEISSQILIITFGLRLSTAMLRFYASEEDKVKKARIVFTAFWASLISIGIFNAFTHPFSSDFSAFFFDTREFSTYFTLLIAWTSFEILNQLALDLIRVKERPGLYITATISKFVIVLITNIYLIAFRGMGIEGIILGQLFGSVALFLMTLPFLMRAMSFSIDFKVFREMFNYGFPLIFSGISSFILAVGDRYLVKVFLSYDDVGIYALGYKLSNIIKIVFVQAFQLSFLPIAFNMYHKENANRFFTKVFTYYVLVIFWAGLALSLFSREIINAFATNPDYYDAYLYIPWLTLAICFIGIQNFFMIGIHYAKKTRILATITFFVMLVNVGLNLVLIPRFGLYGAAAAYIAAGLLMTVLNYRQSQKYYPISYELPKLLMIVCLSMALYAVSVLFKDMSVFPRLGLKAALLLVFPFILYVFRFYEPVEINRISGIWRKWRNPKFWYRNLKDLSLKQSVDSTDL